MDCPHLGCETAGEHYHGTSTDGEDHIATLKRELKVETESWARDIKRMHGELIVIKQDRDRLEGLLKAEQDIAMRLEGEKQEAEEARESGWEEAEKWKQLLAEQKLLTIEMKQENERLRRALGWYAARKDHPHVAQAALAEPQPIPTVAQVREALAFNPTEMAAEIFKDAKPSTAEEQKAFQDAIRKDREKP